MWLIFITMFALLQCSVTEYAIFPRHDCVFRNYYAVQALDYALPIYSLIFMRLRQKLLSSYYIAIQKGHYCNVLYVSDTKNKTSKYNKKKQTHRYERTMWLQVEERKEEGWDKIKWGINCKTIMYKMNKLQDILYNTANNL